MSDDKASLKQARSDLLDAFAELDAAITIVLQSASLNKIPPLFGQRLEAVKLHAQRNLEEIDSLVPIRNDVVHSTLEFMNRKGGLSAVYVNSGSVDRFPSSRVLNVADHREITRTVKGAAKRLA